MRGQPGQLAQHGEAALERPDGAIDRWWHRAETHHQPIMNEVSLSEQVAKAKRAAGITERRRMDHHSDMDHHSEGTM
ncbi:hypothetical protein GCM10009579_87730 [Streptomyces javensis]|uniref:Uncharacterized protein n=1 Tax=Streptomyces javensis TaxID=114698 RepID=A0ABN1XE47_9ACTN